MKLMYEMAYEPLPEGITALFDRVAAACMQVEGLEGAYQAGVMLVDDDAIQELNARMRGMDRSTDVLSFPSVTYKNGKTAKDSAKALRRALDIETGCIHLGDIAISIDHVRAQAAEYGHSLAREAGYLLAHGLFHIMGYDHMVEADKAVMRTQEEKAMRLAGLERESDMEREKLLDMAIAARENAYAPYSHYKVGAALLARDGRIFTGCNIECASYGMTICAERTAICKAVSEGCREFSAIAIASEGSAPYPCGACRQLLYEFSPDMDVSVTWDGNAAHTTLRALLPEGFGPKSLERSQSGVERNEKEESGAGV